MIQELPNGKWRARWDYGHNSYYKYLKREQKALEKAYKEVVAESNILTKSKDKDDKRRLSKMREYAESLLSDFHDFEYEIHDMEKEYGKPVNIKTRRSFTSRHRWQAEQAEELFIEAYEYEADGFEIPRKLEKKISELREAPKKEDFIEELGFQLASTAGFKIEVLEQSNYELALEQSDANEEWLEHLKIKPKDVFKKAESMCLHKENIKLAGKKYIYTGSFISHTTCVKYVESLRTLAKEEKVDGIITNGQWIKYIFLHKTSGSKEILNCVKKLAKDFPIYAIRSNRESADMISNLKELGILFVNRIEDDKNRFLGTQTSGASNKDQLATWRDYTVEKNIYVPTTYVAFEPILRRDKLYYIIGSGSASHNTPSSRIWARSYDGQQIKSSKYDSIGGHILRFDKDSNVHPTSFHYNKDLQAILCMGKAFGPKKAKEGEINLIISDGHFSTVNRDAYSALLQFVAENRKKIKRIVFNGDFLGADTICHWNKFDVSEQIRVKKHMQSFLHEVALTRGMIHEILEYARGEEGKKFELIFKKGNHEISSISKITKSSITHFLDTMFDLEALLDLQDFTIVDGKKPYKIGDTPFLHGHEQGREAFYRNFGYKSTIGHSHRGVLDSIGAILPGMEDQDKVTYYDYHRRPYPYGFAILTEYQGRTEKPEFILLNDSKFYNLDKIVKVQHLGLAPEKKIEGININYKLED